MNNIMTIIKKELARFFGDRRLVFTTVILPGLMIYVMYSFMGEGMMKEFSTADDYVAKAYVVNMPNEVPEGMPAEMGLKSMLNNVSIEWTEWNGEGEDEKNRILNEIKNGEADLLIYFPVNFGEIAKECRMNGTFPENAPNVEIYYTSEKSNSSTAYGRLASILEPYEETYGNLFDVNSMASKGKYGDYDQASDVGMVGKMMAGLLPMLIMTFIFSGCQGVAPESIAGEKERGTIATLLVTPVKRSALALGKVISLSVIALLAGISSFLGTILSLPKMMGGEVDLGAMSYQLTDYALLLAVIISTVLVMVSIISIISANAKSVKEATTMMAPFMVAVMLLSLLPMLGMEFAGQAAYFIPLYNSVKVMNGIFGFNGDVAMAAVTIGVNLVATGVLVTVLTKMFGSENVMFGK